ncbi:class D beta-lactamase [Pontibacter sp. 172403-2]|nr:class D beta-lactamase [Pontibacter sp. 172403-2]MBF9253192.1 class D beta-lactamase [Pontibacter sp. 172403-2]
MKMTIIAILAFFSPLISSGQVDLQQPFKDCHVEGSISIYDYKNRTWLFSDTADAEKEMLPASTFKIINSCIALELDKVKDEHEVFRWDGVERTFFGAEMNAWNKDTDLKNAYKNSTIWYYVELARRIGRKDYKRYLTACNYGNGDLSETGDDFWNYGAFAVSPVDQVAFLKAFYEEKLPFSSRTYRIVKKMMVSETTDNYILRDKTGWTKKDGQDIAWWVGYVERKDNVYFFATRLTKKVTTDNPDFSGCRKKITKAILKKIKAIE